ncbi:hypothetical protein VP1G_11113 [Cytospora mali]|uniref:Uncharacterized protein n=1 Tax=Cytospora mali TaxID=578113 RepID=A0A194V4I6_CYTMA|nr:hypothetical protein VP1G_11113 [Valsa mali var. pyri (nom. inval.)]
MRHRFSFLMDSTGTRRLFGFLLPVLFLPPDFDFLSVPSMNLMSSSMLRASMEGFCWTSARRAGVDARAGGAAGGAGEVARGELDASAEAAGLDVLLVLGDGDGVLGELLEPALSLLGVLVVGAELLQEDVEGLAHAVHGALGVLVQREGLRELEEQRGAVDGLLAEHLVADAQALLEPAARLVVRLEVLQHHGRVVDGRDGVWVVGSVDDVPQLERVLGILQGSAAVTELVEEQAEVEVVEKGLLRVDSNCPLRDHDGLACKLDGGLLLVQLEVEHGELVVYSCDLRVEYAVDLLVQGQRLKQELLAQLLLVLGDRYPSSLQGFFGQGTAWGGVLHYGHNVDDIIGSKCVRHRRWGGSRSRGDFASRLLLFLLVLAIAVHDRGFRSHWLWCRRGGRNRGSESILLDLYLESELQADLAQHLHIAELCVPFRLELEPESLRSLELDGFPQGLGCDLFEGQVRVTVQSPKRLVNISRRLGVQASAKQTVEQVRNAGGGEGQGQVSQILGSNVLERPDNHVPEANIAQALQTRSLTQGCDLAQVSHVDTTLVEQVTQGSTIHREADVVEQLWDGRVPKVGACRSDILLVSCHLLLFGIGLGLLAAEDVWVQRKLEVVHVDPVLFLGLLGLGRLHGLLLGLFSLLLSLLLGLLLGFVLLLLLGGSLQCLGFLLGLRSLGDLCVHPFPHLVPVDKLHELSSQNGHTVGVRVIFLSSHLLQPSNVQWGDAVKIEDVFPAIGSQKALGLHASLQIKSLAILVPDSLLENGNELLVGGNDILTINGTVIDLVLAGFPLLEDSWNDALTNYPLAEVIHDHGPGCVKTVDIQLVDDLHASNVLACSHTCCLVTAFRGERANAVSAEREKDVVVHEDLGIPSFGGVQGRNLATSHQNGSPSCGIVVVCVELGQQTLPKDSVLDALLRKLLGRLELFVPVAQGIGVLHASEEREDVVGEGTIQGAAGMALVIWNVARGSRRLLYSWSCANEEAKDGESSVIRVRRECAEAAFGAWRGKGSNFALDDLLTKNPPTAEVVFLNLGSLLSRLVWGVSGLCGHFFVKRGAGKNTLYGIGAVSRCANEFPDPDHVYPRFLLRVWVLDQVDFGVGADATDLVYGYKVVDTLALVLQVEAGVLQSCWELDDGLSNFVDLLMGRDLLRGNSVPVYPGFGWVSS